MIKFISKYRELLIVLPIMYMLGNMFAPLSYLFFILILGFWTFKKKHDHIIILLFIILVLGDSRNYYLFFIKNLRIIIISFLTLLSVRGVIRKEFEVQPIFFLCIPFFISASISGLNSPDMALSYSKLLSYLFLLFVVFHYLQFHIARSREKLVIDILHLASWVFLLGLIFIILNPSLVFLKGRYRGLLGNPNGLGLYSFFIFSFAMSVWHLYPKYRKSVKILIGLIVVSVILSGSRNSMGAIMLFLIIYKLYRGKSVRRYLFWFAIIPMIVLFFQIISLETILNALGLGEYLRVESITTGTGRYLAWTIGWSYIQESLWLGGGFAYEELMFIRLREFLITTEHQGGLHNSYLTLIMNTGLIGFGLFLSFLIIVMRKIKPRFLAYAFLVSALVSANFESWMVASLNAFTIHFFLVIILLRNYYSLKRI